MKAHILVVDDEPEIRTSVREILEDEGYSVATAENGQTAREALLQRKPDLVLLDIWMPDVDGLTLLKSWQEEKLDLPVIMMSGHGTVEHAVDATRHGAYDFLEKPLSLAKLLLTVQNALEHARLRQENLGLRKRSEPVHEPSGRSPMVQDLRTQAERIAQHRVPVMLMGEAGSGKKVYARYIHAHSAVAQGPFIDRAVASITRENAAQELFGSESAGLIYYGLLERADGGTLFLEEIGDLDLDAQGRLLSALENKNFLRAGGHEPVAPNFRLIVSSQCDLEQEVAQGRFREDLLYHLNVLPLQIPPLREHAQDIPELVQYYINHFSLHENLSYREPSMALLNQLRQYPWPGNVLELKNLVQRLLILGSGNTIEASELPASMLRKAAASQASSEETEGLRFDLPLREARDEFERRYFLFHLRDTHGNVTQTADRAGVERTNLYRKLKGLGIDPRHPESSESN
jgi:two-component system nitrogen regulation response regulator NtrX